MYFYIFQKLNSEGVNIKKCNFVYFPSLEPKTDVKTEVGLPNCQICVCYTPTINGKELEKD